MNLRHPDPGELDAVLALLQANDIADAGVTDWVRDDLRRHWDELDLEQNAWVVELDGQLAGYLDVENRGTGRVIADGYVHPDARGRGVGSELVRLSERHALELAPDGPLRLHIGTLSTADAFFLARGYGRVRSFLRMVIDLDAAPELTSPPEVELRTMRSPEEDHAVYEVLEEAFADDWEHRPRPFEEYAKRTFHDPDFDAFLCPVAVAEGAIVGASLNWWKRNGDWGWIGTLGVRRKGRGRGIGEALVRWSFAEFLRRGERRVALGVDALNETGALRLYERLGMRRFWEAAVWEKELRAA